MNNIAVFVVSAIILQFNHVLCENTMIIEETGPDFSVPAGAESISTEDHTGTVVCRLNLESLTRKENKFKVKDFDGKLCTHLIFSRFLITDMYKIFRDENFFELKKAEEIISAFPDMKILLEVCISHIKDRSDKQEFVNVLMNSEINRSKFVSNMKHIVTILRKLGFSGLHLEAELYLYAEKDNFITFAKELKEEFETANFLITTEIEGHSRKTLKYFRGSIGEISRIFDLVFVRGFNFNSYQESRITGHDSPLYASGLKTENIFDNLKYIIEEEKAEASALVLGISLFAQQYLLNETWNSYPFGFNKEMQTNTIAGLIKYKENCKAVISESESWRMFWDNEAKVPFINRNYNWMSFDNPKSVQEKVIALKSLGLRGVMIFYIDSDDPLGYCANVTYPMLRTVNYAMATSQEHFQSFKTDDPVLSAAALGWISAISIIFVAICVTMAYKIGRKLKSNRIDSIELSTFTRGMVPTGENIQIDEGAYANTEFLPYDSAYEIPPHYQIDKQSIVRGRFGVEYNGQVNDIPVSIKHPTTDKVCIKTFLSEIKVLIYLGRHENIVNLIGADTTGLRRGIIYTFVEACPLGNLQSYLRANGGNFISLVADDTFCSTVTILPEKNYKISSANLLLWSYQIAEALQFLSQKKVRHGDLSAQNVLLSQKNVAKVTNIGVTRKYLELKPQKTGKEPKSWRWAAVESLSDQIYSTPSDVWSFGVTVWEIFSLGATPYASLTWMAQFPETLKHNLRLQKPTNATTELYNFMTECWRLNPSERPKPEDITSYFARLRQESLFQNYHLLVEDAGTQIDESTV